MCAEKKGEGLVSKKGGYKHVIGGRRCGKSSFLYDIFLREYMCDMTVEYWLSQKSIGDFNILTYPNAAIAAKLKNSPLMKAME